MPEPLQEQSALTKPLTEQPPRPKLVVRVGVTGHREETSADLKELRKQILSALQIIRTIAQESLSEGSPLFDSEQKEPVLRVISPLAQGADHLVAQVALDSGYTLHCPLPFPEEDYRKDFKDSVQHFDRLLGQAERVFALDHPYEPEDGRTEGYEAAGRLVLRQSDVLIAVWNGRPAEKIGGTGQIVREALAFGIPTLWIESNSPHSIMLLNPQRHAEKTDKERSLEELLRERLMQSILPYSNAKAKKKKEKEKEARTLQKFLSELLPQVEEKERKAEELPQVLNHTGDAILWRSFRSADHLANRFGPPYRLAYRAVYLLGALAVFLAYLGSTATTLPWFLPADHHLYLWAELAVLVVIFFLTGMGSLQRWHERWLDYRHLAESLRTMRLLVLIGHVTPSFQVPAHLGKGDPRKTWFHFYLRALVRDVGLVRASMESSYLGAFRLFLGNAIEGQIEYHKDVQSRNHISHTIWHRFAQALFIVAAVACVRHFWVNGTNEEPYVLALNLAVIVLPAFGGAIGATLHHGESERIANRSEALKEQLVELQADLKKLGESPTYRELASIAEQFSNITQSELTDWRFLFLARPLTLPA